MPPKASVLIVDDESGIRQSLCSVLRDEGYLAESAGSGEECLKILSGRRFDVVMLDIWLPGIDGVETLEKIQAMENPPAVIMISGHGTIETAVRATKLGAFDFIEKPLSIDKTLLTIEHAADQTELSLENQRLQEELYGPVRIMGDSVPMKALRQQIGLAAPTNGRVLIFGESGAGKELVAHALHHSGPRHQRQFVEVNCAAIPEELIESELFGHVKGSFTGAISDKSGKFAQADGGTLFLDEIGDMSLRTQSKVLRVIEEQRFTPVGSGSTMNVDVRIIAATNKNLEDEIHKGNFREDLFYRLNVIPFFVPALREHKEDVPTLANYFLAEFSRTYGRRPKQFAATAMESMTAYRWPGNVRELRNLVERLVILVPGIRVERRHLPSGIHAEADRAKAARAAWISRPDESFSSLQEARAAYERDYILRKLGENRGNMSRTAAVLGLERSHLYRKMKSLGISTGES
ncbi:MAG: sigma-54-dependent Fis family transcriptional regulator [Acidobacteriota bacterium]|nr:sigma-54-dependent Fis family transcriptional regulator [Acidobacteriota bacterium]